jgi:hypothetical protein
MCFQMGRNQPGFAIASIRRHLIFKETSEQKFIPPDRGGFDLHWYGQMAGGGHENPIKFRESHLASAGHAGGVF